MIDIEDFALVMNQMFPREMLARKVGAKHSLPERHLIDLIEHLDNPKISEEELLEAFQAMLERHNGKTFPLFGATDAGTETTVFSRGHTPDEGYDRAANSRAFERGQTVVLMDHCGLHWAELYRTNHPFDWLHIPPRDEFIIK